MSLLLMTPSLDAAASSSGDWMRREVQLDVVPSHGLAEQSLSDISKALLVVSMWLCITTTPAPPRYGTFANFTHVPEHLV